MTGGGAERVASVLAGDLSQEFNLHVVLFNGPVDYTLPSGIQLHFLRREPHNRLWRLLGLFTICFRYRKFCRRHQIQVSLSFDNLANYINATLSLLKSNRTRIILSERNPPSVRYHGLQSLAFLHSILIRWLYPKANAIIPCSKGIGYDLQKQFDLSSKNIIPVYSPIPVDAIINKKGENVVANETPFAFIHVGNFREQKNHAFLIHAFYQFNQPDTELWLVGKGPLQKSCREEVKRLGLEQRVIFHDFQSNPYELMGRAHCMVLYSRYEGFPIVLLEALVCSLPVISSDCPYGPREILAPDSPVEKSLRSGMEMAEYGILIPVGDRETLIAAMRKMHEDHALRKQYQAKALSRAMVYDHRHITPLFANIIGSLAKPVS